MAAKRSAAEAASTSEAPAFATKFLDYINETPTPFHLCAVTGERLVAAGFTELSEETAWGSTKAVCVCAARLSVLAHVSRISHAFRSHDLSHSLTMLSHVGPACKVVAGGKYFYTRNKSTLVAFVVGGAYKPGGGFKVRFCAGFNSVLSSILRNSSFCAP